LLNRLCNPAQYSEFWKIWKRHLWHWLYGSGNQCHHHATYIVRTDDRLLEEQLFEEGNILHGKKHDQEMVRQFFFLYASKLD
jgi:hypothetical protein